MRPWNKQNSRKDATTGVGGASVILMMIVLGLTVFALLAIRSSVNERQLTEKTAESIREYYLMEQAASELVAEIDNRIVAYVEGGSNESNLASCLAAIPGVGSAEGFGDEAEVFCEIPSSIREGVSLRVSLTASPEQLIVREWRICNEEPEGYEIEILD